MMTAEAILEFVQQRLDLINEAAAKYGETASDRATREALESVQAYARI